MLRKAYTDILKTILRTTLCETRKSMQLTQSQMAERLAIDTRSYSDLEHGISMCGTLTMLLFLVYCCDDPLSILNEIRESLESVKNDAA